MSTPINTYLYWKNGASITYIVPTFGLVGATISDITGSLPTGLSYNSSTGTILGTLSATAGAYTWTYTLTGTYQGGVLGPDKVVTRIVNLVIQISDLEVVNLVKGSSVTWVSTGSQTTPWTGTLPSGLSVTSPSTGYYQVTGTVSAVAGAYQTSFATFVVSNASPMDPPVISCAGATWVDDGWQLTLPAGPIAFQLVATNGGSNWSTSLPSGLSSTYSTGLATTNISGTLSPGTYTMASACYNTAYSGGPNQTANFPLKLIITPNLPVITGPSATALSSYTGKAASAQFSVQALAGTVAWSSSDLPEGLALGASTGLVSGVPTGSGNFSTTITATNSTGSTDFEAVFTILAATQPPVISCAGATPTDDGGELTVTAGSVTVAFSATNGGSNWSLSVPGGMSSSNGVANGTLTPGTYQLVAQASNTPYSGGNTQTAQYILTLTVAPAMAMITLGDSGALSIAADAAAAAQFSVQDAAGVVVWAASGLPPGCSINSVSGLVSGKPSVAGSFSATITATNSAGTAEYLAVFVVAGDVTTATPYQFLADDLSLIGVLVEKTTRVATLLRTDLKVGDVGRFAVVFLENGAPVDPPAASGVKMAMRVSNKWDEDYLFESPTFTLTPGVAEGVGYLLGEVSFSGALLAAEMRALKAAEETTAALPVMSDLKWLESGHTLSSARVNFTLSPRITT